MSQYGAYAEAYCIAVIILTHQFKLREGRFSGFVKLCEMNRECLGVHFKCIANLKTAKTYSQLEKKVIFRAHIAAH